jgi:hypothetical protein
MNVKALQRLILSLAFALQGPIAIAAPPHTINYQGYLTNTVGAPVNGTMGMTFKFYNVESGGSFLYSELQSVIITNGNFNVVLGSPTPIPLPFDAPYWITVTITGDPEMSPRQPLASSPYAFRAAALDSNATVAGLQVSGTITSATLPTSNLTGTIVSAQIANNAVTQAKLSPLTGAAAGKVLGTDGSNLQWQTVIPAPAPGITFVTPFSVPRGRIVTVYVLGEATNFDGTTSVSAGAGVIVSSIVPISRAALQVTLSVASGASIGPRSVTVMTGAQVLTLPGALFVISPLTAVVTAGALSQGGSALVLAQAAAGRTFAPGIAGNALTVSNATFTLSTGVSLVSNRWFAADTAELLVEVSPFADFTSNANLVVNYTGGGTDTASNFAAIGVNPITPVTLGTPTFGALFAPREAGLFSVVVAGAPVTLNFSVSPTPIADVNAASGSVMFATNGTYVFSVVDRNGGGGFTGYGFTISLSP